MPARRFAAAAFAFALVGTASVATAQSVTTVHGVGTFSLAHTDNLLGAPPDPGPDEQGPIDTWFLELSPGITLIHDGPQALHTFTYLHPITLYFEHPDSNARSDVATWQGFFTPSPRDELTLGVSVERSHTRLASFQTGADQTTARSQLSGDNVMLQANFMQGYSRDFSAQWAATQTAGVGVAIPLDVPAPQSNRYEVHAGGGPQYTIGRNAFALLGNITYFATSEVDEDGVFAEGTSQIILSSLFRWRHDLSADWSTESSAGIAAAVPAHLLRGGVWGPIGLGAVRYHSQGYEVEAMVHRTLTPDLITARTLMADHLRLSGGVPIDRENHVVLRSSGSYSHNRVLAVADSGYVFAAPFSTPETTDENRLLSTFDIWAFDASIGWYPENLPYFTLRYLHLEQIGEETRPAPATTFSRNTGMLTVGMMWPPRDAPAVPQGPGQRVDNSDRDDRIPGGGSGDAPGRGPGAGRARNN